MDYKNYFVYAGLTCLQNPKYDVISLKALSYEERCALLAINQEGGNSLEGFTSNMNALINNVVSEQPPQFDPHATNTVLSADPVRAKEVGRILDETADYEYSMDEKGRLMINGKYPDSGPGAAEAHAKKAGVHKIFALSQNEIKDGETAEEAAKRKFQDGTLKEAKEYNGD